MVKVWLNHWMFPWSEERQIYFHSTSKYIFLQNHGSVRSWVCQSKRFLALNSVNNPCWSKDFFKIICVTTKIFLNNLCYNKDFAHSVTFIAKATMWKSGDKLRYSWQLRQKKWVETCAKRSRRPGLVSFISWSVDSFIHFPLYLVWPYDFFFWFCILPTKLCVRVMWQNSLPGLITHVYQTNNLTSCL